MSSLRKLALISLETTSTLASKSLMRQSLPTRTKLTTMITQSRVWLTCARLPVSKATLSTTPTQSKLSKLLATKKLTGQPTCRTK